MSGALKVYDPAAGDWQTVSTQGPVGAPGPQGEVGPQGIQGVPGGAVVLYRSPYLNTWISDVSATALKTVFTAEVQIDDPTGDFMVVSGWRCISDVGAAVGMAQLEVRVGSYLAPTHTVISAGENETLWGGVSRVWFPAGSAIAAAPGPVTISMKMIINVGERTVYDPSLYLIQLNSETASGGGATGPIFLDDLEDVAATGPSGGQVLGWDDTAQQWAPIDVAGSGDLTAPVTIHVEDQYTPALLLKKAAAVFPDGMIRSRFGGGFDFFMGTGAADPEIPIGVWQADGISVSGASAYFTGKFRSASTATANIIFDPNSNTAGSQAGINFGAGGVAPDTKLRRGAVAGELTINDKVILTENATGGLTLGAEPVAPTDATTKNYVDTSTLSLSGGTLTGELILPDQVTRAPSSPQAAATVEYVGQTITISDTAPTGPPARDGLVWAVVEVPSDAVITLDYAVGAAGFTVSGAYTVDWGDGSAVESYAAAAPAAHTYTVAASATITPQTGGDLTSFALNPAVPQPTSMVLDAPALKVLTLYLNYPSTYTLESVSFPRPVALDNCIGLFDSQAALVSVTGALDTSNNPMFMGMFHGCTSLTTAPSLDVSAGTMFTQMFGDCTLLTTVPDLDTSAATDFSVMFQNCTALTTAPDLDMSSGTKFDGMFNGCTALTTVPDLDVASGTNFSQMFYNCTALTTIPALDVTSGTSFSSMFGGCSALTSILAFGFTKGVGVNGTSLDAAALDVFFTNLGAADPAPQGVNITGTPGAATCDRTLATAKGFTVTG